MKTYKFIPYDKNLVSRSRELRKETTEAERLLWEKVLKNKQLRGLKFTRQKPVGHFILDFYCAQLQLGIEIDGKIHEFQKVRDRERDNMLKLKFGITTVRYRNKEILNNIKGVIKDLREFTKSPDKGI